MRRLALVSLALFGCRGILGIEDVTPASGDPVDAGGEADASIPPDAMQFVCSVDLPCPEPGGSTLLSVCGRVLDTTTSAAIEQPGLGRSCADASGAPCTLEIQAFDALEFFNNPTGATPLASSEQTLDTCGRYSFVDLERPALGGVVFTVTDPSMVHVNTGVGGIFAADQAHDLDLYATRAQDDQRWTTTANEPFGGPTFSESGAVLMLFDDNGTPVAGVNATRNGAVVVQAERFHLVGLGNTLDMVDPNATSTGATGAVLVINSTLVSHSGTGGERANCEWQSDLADAVPGFITIAPRSLLDAGTTDPCP